MSGKRKQATELMDGTRTKFAKTIQHGTWREFLLEDANVTRKAFARWWIEVCLKSPHGKALPGNIKAEIKGLIETRPPNPISRESLLDGTVLVIQRWESIPLVKGSPEWAKARVRLIRDLIMDGRFRQYKDHFDLVATSEEMGHARCWIYQRDDGQLDHYRSLAQPWSYKDIEWSNEGPVTKLADPALTAADFPRVPANPTNNLNRLRISETDFELHLLGVETAMEPSMEGEVVQQQHVIEEHAHKEDDRGIIEQPHPRIKGEQAYEGDDEVEVIQQPHIKEEHAQKEEAEVEITHHRPIKQEHADGEEAEV
ncbi:MAG: hypothetical protein L6R38_002108 [Xanthoria sp. 2 TBL-2021]|nr:MAG: hypothetical protein L6R38_002108 [Xanthoria sp. 2 TBL-2021]